MTDAASRMNAALHDRYRIERELGAGGMATVYLAQDLKHDRKVAVKVLKPELAAVIGADRFLAEIRTTANLQHPHILPLHDSGVADGLLFYVMPYVDGETLRARLDREGVLPVPDAVRIATNMAEALDYAHGRGVIHRDIKPENVLLQHGKPVIADFGIALALTAGGSGRLTETGMSLGTPSYMSPEQATGDRKVGPATDIFSLGCVLHEMLVGEPPFTGRTPQAVLGKLIAGRIEPMTTRRKSIPPHVEAVVEQALEKIPADRFGSAAEVARALGDPGFRRTGGRPTPAAALGRWGGLFAGAALCAGALIGWLARSGPDVENGVTRYVYTLPDSQSLGAMGVGTIGVSPDGRYVAYFANRQLWLKPMDAFEARQVDGAPAGAAPFFSPDGRWIAFFSDQQLWRIPAIGGAPERLAQVGGWFYGASWETDGFIYFANADGVMRVPEAGGAVQVIVTTTDPADAYGPRLLPGGEWLLYTLAESYTSNRWNESKIIARSLSSGQEHVIGQGSDARYLSTGHLVYAVESTLYVVEFDARTLEPNGVPTVVAEPVQRATNPIYWGGTAHYDVSTTGTLVHVPAVQSTGGTVVRLDRQGRNEQPLAGLTNLGVAGIRLSPDGQRLAFVTEVPGDIWVYEMTTGRLRRVTNDGGNRWAEWINDRIIAFTSGRAGTDNIFAQRWDRADEPRQITTSDYRIHLGASSGDGRRLAYHVHGPGDVETRVVLSLEIGPDDTVEVIDEVEMNIPGDINSFSPDGSWVAYSAGGNVFVTRADGTGSLVPVSTDGGGWGLWRTPNELFYRHENQVWSVSIDVGQDVRVGIPEVLFEGEFIRGPGTINFEILDGGQSFILVVPGEDVQPVGPRRDRFHVTQNWFEELRQSREN